jgi:hypothetical protein
MDPFSMSLTTLDQATPIFDEVVIELINTARMVEAVKRELEK